MLTIKGLRELQAKLKRLDVDLAREIDTANEDVADKAVKYAKEAVPVRTGELRDNIDKRKTLNANATRLTWDVYNTLDYAWYVELGTVLMAAQPYLLPAVTRAYGEYLERLQRAVERAAAAK